MQVYGNKDEMIHALDINKLSRRPGNVIVADTGRIHIEGYQKDDNKFEITYYYDSEQRLLSVLYVNDLYNCKVLYYKDNEDVDNDEIDDAIEEHIKKWFNLMEPLYEMRGLFVSSICYDNDSKTNYMSDKIVVQLPDVFIDENYVAKAISHTIFETAIIDPVNSIIIIV